MLMAVSPFHLTAEPKGVYRQAPMPDAAAVVCLSCSYRGLQVQLSARLRDFSLSRPALKDLPGRRRSCGLSLGLIWST